MFMMPVPVFFETLASAVQTGGAASVVAALTMLALHAISLAVVK